ncbi:MULTISPECIES: nucleoside hydrolase [Sutcliffiella]|uniref:Nucleoside hydrolase n=1 Tax=Sutcliffiella cohnii TaxID=33932 RepID=A0A223KKJ0_9BACI|nr:MULTISPECIES: nucleoside hydrolase [Sutcliffiella]AST89873.1 nucleoside hydrolase [Sutcliffiella cohnii]WBL15496.1 nucleoside hydrolase [Sutcliffiella sp. NC1]
MKPIIFDVDTGIDDALAMSYALHSPELELLGFTTCFGNVPVDEATRNTLAVLEKVGKHVPVYEGAAQMFIRGEKKVWAKHVHGEDGLGNSLQHHPTTKAESQSAPDFMIEQVKKRPQEITIIAVGPLTNVALAIQKAPEIIPLIKEVIIMGGAVTVPGNVNAFAEANMIADPEAADYVFSSGLNITLVGLDITLQTLLPKSKLAEWRATGKETAQFFADITDFYINYYESYYPGIGGCALHDPLAVGVAIDASLVSAESMNVKVTLEGEEVGRTVGYPEDEPKIRVCTKVDAARFLEHFLSRVVG